MMFRCKRCHSDIICQEIINGIIEGLEFNENLEIIKYKNIDYNMGLFYCNNCKLASYNPNEILELKN